MCRHSDIDPAALLHELRSGSDHTMIDQYFDAIDKLVALVVEGRGVQAKEEGLCNTVIELQEVCWLHVLRSCCGSGC